MKPLWVLDTNVLVTGNGKHFVRAARHGVSVFSPREALTMLKAF